MRAHKSEQTGSAGADEVSAKFARIGWGPVRRTDPHDLGTDLLVQVRDARRFDLGLFVGVQVKAGPSYFKEAALDGPDESIAGWWYYESDDDHFDHWVTHVLPHLLVLHDLEADVSYWVHITPEVVRSTGKGNKVFVPVIQRVDHDSRGALLSVAAQQKTAPTIEGTAFQASAASIPPGRRIRHALLAPRMVAPHRNKGFGTPISPEEALALMAEGRFLDVRHFAQRHENVPDPSNEPMASNWKWQLVSALWSWATADEVEPLRDAFEYATDAGGRAASGVLLACALLREEKHRDALGVVGTLVEGDELGPVDHAWVLVQRARIRAELGDVVGSRTDAESAKASLLGDADDITSSALTAAAEGLLFSTSGFTAADLDTVIAASDTAITWWRSQRTLAGLEEASSRAFRSWTDDDSVHYSAEDSEATSLFAAELNADVAGEHGSWRALSALAARNSLMSAHLFDDETERVTADSMLSDEVAMQGRSNSQLHIFGV